MPFSNLPKGVIWSRNISISLRTKCQFITEFYKAQHNPTSAILSTVKWCPAPPNSIHVDLLLFLKYTKLFSARGPTALATSLPRESSPSHPTLHITVAPCHLSGLCALTDCPCHSGSQRCVFPSWPIQISLETVSSVKAGSSLSSLVYPQLLGDQLSTVATPLYILLCTMGESPEFYFPEDFSLNASRWNSASGDTYLRFEMQKKRRNRYSSA